MAETANPLNETYPQILAGILNADFDDCNEVF